MNLTAGSLKRWKKRSKLIKQELIKKTEMVQQTPVKPRGLERHITNLYSTKLENLKEMN